MHPLVPYFRGEEKPPHPRLTTVQKCFRTTDIENVGNTARHLTFFEMLGNFSIGDYFKQEAVEMAWELSLDGLRLRPRRHLDHGLRGRRGARPRPRRGGDRGVAVGRRAARADRPVPALGELLAGRADAGRAGRAASCTSTAAWSGAPRTTCPAARTSASWSTGTSSSRSTTWASTRTAATTLAPLPANNIDTGLGLERMAVIQQGVETVFETDTFAPLMALGRELAAPRSPTSARCGSSPTTRAR